MNEPVDAGLVYRARRNALEYETRYALEADALAYQFGRAPRLRGVTKCTRVPSCGSNSAQ